MSEVLLKHLRAGILRLYSEVIAFTSEISDTIDNQDARITTLENNSGSSLFYLDNDGDLCETDRN